MAVTAIFGGTFNPFHIGHYEMLSAINELSFVDRIFLMPDKIPPHKTCDYIAPDSDRIEMCKTVCEDFKKTELCLIEFEREGKSYTFDTVNELKKLYPNEKFYFVCGGDMITSLDTWYKWDTLIKQIGFIAFYRESEGEAFKESINKLKALGADIKVLNKAITDISSTELRQNISNSKSKELIPEKVYAYIIKRGLYCDRNS